MVSRRSDKASQAKRQQHDPFERFLLLKQFVLYFCNICGLQIIDIDFKWNIFTYLLLSMILCYGSFSLWTLWVLRGNYFKQLETLCCYGIYIAGLGKLVSALQYYKVYATLFADTETLYRINWEGARVRILSRCIDTTRYLSYAMTGTLAVGATIFVSYPFYSLLVRGEKMLILNVFVPFLDHRTNVGFAATTIIQIVFSVLGCIGNMGFDLIIQILISSYRTRIELLEQSLSLLSEMWQKPSAETTLTYRKLYLRNIILGFQDTERYINFVRHSLHRSISIQIICSAVSISISLICIVINDWTPGFGYVTFSLTQLLVMSYLGTIVQNGQEELCRICYDTKWYLFAATEQKLMAILLHKSQNSKIITVVGLYPLNVETGLSIVQCIYKYFMMLMSFLE